MRLVGSHVGNDFRRHGAPLSSLNDGTNPNFCFAALQLWCSRDHRGTSLTNDQRARRLPLLFFAGELQLQEHNMSLVRSDKPAKLSINIPHTGLARLFGSVLLLFSSPAARMVQFLG